MSIPVTPSLPKSSNVLRWLDQGERPGRVETLVFSSVEPINVRKFSESRDSVSGPKSVSEKYSLSAGPQPERGGRGDRKRSTLFSVVYLCIGNNVCRDPEKSIFFHNCVFVDV